MFIYSPLEQFAITSVFSIFGISLTNQFLFFILILFIFFTFFLSLLNESSNTLFVIPSRWQLFLETCYTVVLSMVQNNIKGEKGQLYFPFIFSLFFFISSMNLIGLVPYSFTITSHFAVTLSLSIMVFIAMNIICINTHKLAFFSLFFPAGTSMALSFLLVPVELISYIFKPISLAVRLFCNLMAGHTLLKVIAGFAWSLVSSSGVLFFFQFAPIFIIVPLYGLELAVGVVQSFIFCLLTCIYLNDAVNLH